MIAPCCLISYLASYDTLDRKNQRGKASIAPWTGRQNQMKFASSIAVRRLAARLLALAALLALVPAGLQAAQSEWQGDPMIGEARLVSAVTATGDLQQVPLGVEFTLAPGWKIYWRTPGEAGLAPAVDLSQSATPGLTGHFRWPLAKRFDAFGFDNFGYENSVILPFDVTGHAAGAPLQLTADLEALACADICVPITARLDLFLPDGAAMPSPHAQAMAQYRAMVPRPAGASGLSASGPSISIIAAEARDGGLYVELAAGSPPVADIFVEGVDQVTFKAPVPRKDGARHGMFMAAVPPDGLALAGRDLTLTVSAPPEMAEIKVRANADADANTGGSAAAGSLSLRIIAMAFLGGLILNLMPCVLPVLALKLSAVLTAVGAPRRVLRLRFLAGAAGIVTSFLILAGGLAALRLAGGTVGWGIQFQNPVFLAVMIAMLGLFALSLIDGVTIPVPRAAQSLAGMAGGPNDTSYRGDFFAGMLATILATPCSAPFVGTAVAVALSGSMGDLFGIFLALGFGLAAPWLLVAAKPSLVAMLPRPGPWMVRLKQVLALLLVGTMVWLGSVLSTLVRDPQAAGSADAAIWAGWSRQAMVDSLAAGTPVLVDVTADWCVTCKANKALVLDREPVSSALHEAMDNGRLVLLRADWTRPDDEIAAFLARHGRYGIPFNILLTPDGRADVIFGEILTTSSLLSALENAAVTAK